MSDRLLRVAVVGHTNTGKTSLMRTLMRDVSFGEVSDRPAVTKDVEAAVLSARGRPVLELFDTPGLEDSIGLLEHLETKSGGTRRDGVELIDELIERDPAARDRFAQEAKALRQVRRADCSLYVIDVRERVLGKHRDELTILGMCARPVVPVLNFTASPDAMTETWREHLSRVNMHAVAEFDTVVFDADDERRLFEKMRSLLDEHRQALDDLIADRRDTRRMLLHSSAAVVAELLVDVAAYRIVVPTSKRKDTRSVIEKLKDAVRRREQACVEALLELHHFRTDDVQTADLPIEDGAWGLDLFSKAALKRFGVSTGGGAAAGAMAGLAIDAMLGGASLGAGAAAGAAVGGLLGAAGSHGRKMVDGARGLTEVRCAEPTVQLLAMRQIELVRALLRRGHASMELLSAVAKPGADDRDARAMPLTPELAERLEDVRERPAWSRLDGEIPPSGAYDPARMEELQILTLLIEPMLDREA
jgi:GTPase Era involved in 16S rRNA processing